ncbi:hypothetical protein [Acidianus brierleyi]|nr:hypothetical protein [Acidianus brierleyi]
MAKKLGKKLEDATKAVAKDTEKAGEKVKEGAEKITKKGKKEK